VRKEGCGEGLAGAWRSGAQSRVARASARRDAFRSCRAAARRLTGTPRRGTQWASLGGPSPADSAARQPSAASRMAATSSGAKRSHAVRPNSTRRFTYTEGSVGLGRVIATVAV
jgi:hypothetical protein